MAPVLQKEEIGELIARARAQETLWNCDFRRRSEFSRRALASSDRLEALMLIKTIYQRKKDLAKEGKDLHTTDAYFLRDAEFLLYHEFAFVLEKSFEEVSHEVKKALCE